MNYSDDKPCLNCTSRCVGCHSTCERYIRAKQRNDARRNYIASMKRKEYALNKFKRDCIDICKRS